MKKQINFTIIIAVLCAMPLKNIQTEDWGGMLILFLPVGPIVGSIIGQCACEKNAHDNTLGGVFWGSLGGFLSSIVLAGPLSAISNSPAVAFLGFIAVGSVVGYYLSNSVCSREEDTPKLRYFVSLNDNRMHFSSRLEKIVTVGMSYAY